MLKNLVQVLQADTKTALKSHDTAKRSFLQMLKASSQAIAKPNPVTPEDVQKAAIKLKKEYSQEGAQGAQEKLPWLTPYLPQMISDEELEKIVGACKEQGMNLGQMMSHLSREYGSRANKAKARSFYG